MVTRTRAHSNVCTQNSWFVHLFIYKLFEQIRRMQKSLMVATLLPELIVDLFDVFVSLSLGYIAKLA